MQNLIVTSIDDVKDAINNGNLELFIEVYKSNRIRSKFYCAYAASVGQFEILKWLFPKELHQGTFNAAIEAGRLDIVQWLYKQECRWDSKTCGTLRRCKQYEIFKWLKDECGYSCWCLIDSPEARERNIIPLLDTLEQ